MYRYKVSKKVSEHLEIKYLHCKWLPIGYTIFCYFPEKCITGGILEAGSLSLRLAPKKK